MQTKLIPKLITVFREGYNFKTFLQDLNAGILVGIVALPLAIAFAIASGVKPEQGLYTAIVGGFFLSLLSGSRFLIGGPTGAFIVLIYSIVQKFGYEGLATATLMAGIILIIMGVARMGAIIKFIPYPVTLGFTTGIGVIIFITQIPDFFGLTIEKIPSEFFERIYSYYLHASSYNSYATLIGILSIVIIIYWPKINNKIPGHLVAILVTTLLVKIFQLPVATIGSRFGEVPHTLPSLHLPSFNWELIRQLIPSATAIALLAGIESLLAAVVADGMKGTRHRSNMELVAQGVANVISPFFGGIPATGAIARTATNIKSGGQTPIAGIIHALTVLVIMLFLGKWATLIPMCSLAGILIVVSYNMSELHMFAKLFRAPKADVLVLLTTFSLTVLIDLTVAIEVGIVLASLLFMHRMASVTQLGFITESLNETENPNDPLAIYNKKVPKGVEVFEINGPFFFGAVDQFKNSLSEINPKPKILILRMRHVLTIDATAIYALEDVYHKTNRSNITLILSGVHAQPLIALERSGLLEKMGENNVCANIDLALARAKEIVH